MAKKKTTKATAAKKKKPAAKAKIKAKPQAKGKAKKASSKVAVAKKADGPKAKLKAKKVAKPAAAKKSSTKAKATPVKKAVAKGPVKVKPTAAKKTGQKISARPEDEANDLKSDAKRLEEALSDDVSYEEAEAIIEEVVLTDAEGRRYCKVTDCDQISMVETYCRYHYLLFWKKIQIRKKILTEGKLERYIEELTARYPDKYLDMLRKDLRSEKDFMAAIHELELDENSSEGDFEDETQNFIDEIRGVSTETSAGRDDDDY